ncbi:mitochondrial carrier domain-containing protein [Suillus subalutaceus]|uniref:mitochondrial carrier domain-containing protein n=1 Tax=Suillus subalutaceus TaxID=48586 RepID=UPI001B87A899|nr:mitochondrial carrier domain-containing protein [Suillus subalutaceus]KAG1857359.1 mitochondrial carrier domain-containing protein [Suillus subalutaceus]
MPVDHDPTTDFIAGTTAGIVGLLIAHPFDTVKVRLQNPDLSSRYHSVSHAFATIIREERFSGLYKGIASPLATCAFMNGLVFASYKFFLKAQMVDGSIPSLTEVAIAGSCCGVAMSIFATPIELIKIRQQNMLESGLGSVSASKLIYTIHREHGLKGLFRGLTATAFRDLGYGAYFFGYEASSRYLTSLSPGLNGSTSLSDSSQRSIPLWMLFISGGVAGVVGWLPTFPMDVVKTRMQSTETPGARSIMRPEVTTGDNPYRTTISTIQHSYRTGGAGGFLRGLSPTMLRAIPVNMATFAVYETVVGILSP